MAPRGRRRPLQLHGDDIPARQQRARHWRHVTQVARTRLVLLAALYLLFLSWFLLALPR